MNYAVAIISARFLLENKSVIADLIHKHRLFTPPKNRQINNTHSVIFVCYWDDCDRADYFLNQEEFKNILQYMPTLYTSKKLVSYKFRMQGMSHAYHLTGRRSSCENLNIEKCSVTAFYDPDDVKPIIYFSKQVACGSILRKIMEDYKIDRTHLLELYKRDDYSAQMMGSIQASEATPLTPTKSRFALRTYPYAQEIKSERRPCATCQGGAMQHQETKIDQDIDHLYDIYLANQRFLIRPAAVSSAFSTSSRCRLVYEGSIQDQHQAPDESSGCCCSSCSCAIL